MIDSFWPETSAFIDISSIEQLTDGSARCTDLAICDADGAPARRFLQGQAAHFFYEFELRDAIAVPCGGLEFRNANGLVVHGKNTFQHDTALPQSVEAGQCVRIHQEIRLDIAMGTYDVTVGFASIDAESYRRYVSGEIGDEQFAPREHCRVGGVASFSVELDPRGKLRHHGVANLDGGGQLTLRRAPDRPAQRARREEVEADMPALVHVTHWKSGSQWILKILAQCAPDRIVEPTPSQSQFLYSPIQPGKIYPTVYVTKPQFDRTRPPGTRYFVVIRDLRDTLASAYFSFKISHPLITRDLAALRSMLEEMPKEEGLLYLMDNWLPYCSQIQLSWKESGERLIRYEDLLGHDAEILEEVLLADPALRIDRDRLRQAIVANRFESLTGRARGAEEPTAHERVGAAGDWRNHFTERVKDAFKARFGGLLVATGYERDLDW